MAEASEAFKLDKYGESYEQAMLAHGLNVEVPESPLISEITERVKTETADITRAATQVTPKRRGAKPDFVARMAALNHVLHQLSLLKMRHGPRYLASPLEKDVLAELRSLISGAADQSVERLKKAMEHGNAPEAFNQHYAVHATLQEGIDAHHGFDGADELEALQTRFKDERSLDAWLNSITAEPQYSPVGQCGGRYKALITVTSARGPVSRLPIYCSTDALYATSTTNSRGEARCDLEVGPESSIAFELYGKRFDSTLSKEGKANIEKDPSLRNLLATRVRVTVVTPAEEGESASIEVEDKAVAYDGHFSFHALATGLEIVFEECRYNGEVDVRGWSNVDRQFNLSGFRIQADGHSKKIDIPFSLEMINALDKLDCGTVFEGRCTYRHLKSYTLSCKGRDRCRNEVPLEIEGTE